MEGKGRPNQQGAEIPRLSLNDGEKKQLQDALNQVNRLVDQMGLFDPLELESPMIYFAEEGKR